MAPFRVCLEATSLLGPRSGVGHTTAALVEHLVAVDPDVELSLLPLTARGAGELRSAVGPHPRVTALRLRIPARLAQTVWTRLSWPPAELFCGRADVVHGPNHFLPPMLRAAGVLTVHDLAFERMPETCSPHVRTYSRTVPVSAGRAQRIIVPSRFVADEVAAWLPGSADRIRVVPPGVRDAFREPGGALTEPRRRDLGVGSLYAVYLGNLESRKNLGVLLDAFGRVRAEMPDAQLVLVGRPGFGWDAISARHADLLASPAVVVCGGLPDGEAAALIRGARAFVYPSRYEGFGMPPLEALAAGTPVVATKVASIPEVLGDHARYVHPDDPDDLASAIGDLLHGRPDPNDVYAGRMWASAFTWDRTAAETLRVYREAAAEVAA